jgi:hypothetical protein
LPPIGKEPVEAQRAGGAAVELDDRIAGVLVDELAARSCAAVQRHHALAAAAEAATPARRDGEPNERPTAARSG